MTYHGQSYRTEAYRRAAQYQRLVYGEHGTFSIKGFARAMYSELGRPGMYLLCGVCVWFFWHRCTLWVCKKHSMAVGELIANEEEAFRQSGASVKGEEYIVRGWKKYEKSDEACPMNTLQSQPSMSSPPEMRYKKLERP